MSDIPIWDQEALSGRVRGKTDRMVRLVNMLLDDMPDRIAALHDQLNSRDLTEIRATAHIIKGVAANIGVMQVEEIAYRIENGAKSGVEDNLLQDFSELNDAFDEARGVLSEFVASHSAPN